jgi:hypothetical protein
MDYYDRAKSAYNRQDIVRAAVILAEGLIRDPSNDEGVGWLLRVYVEDLRGPGLERELLRVMSKQRNGHDLYRVVCAELRELEQFEKLEALQKVRRQLGLFTDVPDSDLAKAAVSPVVPARTDDDGDDEEDDDEEEDGDDRDDDDDAPKSAQRSTSAPSSAERWDRFKSPLGGDAPDSDDDAPRTTTLRQRSRPLRAVADDEESLYSRGRSARDKIAQRKRAFVIGGVLLLIFVAVVLFAVLAPPGGQAPPMPFGAPTPTPGLSNPGAALPAPTPDAPPAAVPTGAPRGVVAAPAPEPMLAPPGDQAPDDGSAAGSGAP